MARAGAGHDHFTRDAAFVLIRVGRRRGDIGQERRGSTRRCRKTRPFRPEREPRRPFFCKRVLRGAIAITNALFARILRERFMIAMAVFQTFLRVD